MGVAISWQYQEGVSIGNCLKERHEFDKYEACQTHKREAAKHSGATRLAEKGYAGQIAGDSGTRRMESIGGRSGWTPSRKEAAAARELESGMRETIKRWGPFSATSCHHS